MSGSSARDTLRPSLALSVDFMPLRHDATKLLLSGNTLDEISSKLHRPLAAVIQDLRLQVGEGDLKLSEIFFAISPEKRAALEALIEQHGTDSPSALQKLPAAQGFEVA